MAVSGMAMRIVDISAYLLPMKNIGFQRSRTTRQKTLNNLENVLI